MLAGKDRKGVFVSAELLVGGKMVSSHLHFFEPYKNLVLQRPQIDANTVRTPRGFRVTLSSDKLARAVYLSMVNQTGTFTENYFDLIPGKSVVTEFRTAASISPAQFRERLKIRSLADAF
jgi:beta-mannosidase